MGIPLATISTGLSILGGIQGLLGGNSAAARAREAQRLAIRDMESSDLMDESNTLSSGLRGMYALRGALSDNLRSGGRALGSAMAGAGVYNSSAVAGALANQESANAGALAQYGTGLADTLGRMRSQSRRNIGSMKMGIAENDLNYARSQQAGTVNGLASLLGNLSQLNLGNTGANAYKPNNRGSVLDMTKIPRTPLPFANLQNYGNGFSLGR